MVDEPIVDPNILPEQPPIVHQTIGPFDGLADTTDVLPGEEGWLLLDPAGTPIMFQKAAPMEGGYPACPARYSNDPKTDKIVSLSGSPLSAPLNERPDIRAIPLGEPPANQPVAASSEFAEEVPAEEPAA